LDEKLYDEKGMILTSQAIKNSNRINFYIKLTSSTSTTSITTTISNTYITPAVPTTSTTLEKNFEKVTLDVTDEEEIKKEKNVIEETTVEEEKICLYGKDSQIFRDSVTLCLNNFKILETLTTTDELDKFLTNIEESEVSESELNNWGIKLISNKKNDLLNAISHQLYGEFDKLIRTTLPLVVQIGLLILNQKVNIDIAIISKNKKGLFTINKSFDNKNFYSIIIILNRKKME